ncbi:MAG: 30S ribosomal protein S16 [Candidatus Promineofilum sp.]|nr:30S ribosomal protein S16 [Promineifilum sp.]
MLRIRLSRTGKKRQPSYRVVVAEKEAKRDGRVVERIGHYNPLTNPAEFKIDEDRALYWLSVGAQPSDAVRVLLNKQGTFDRLTRLNAGESREALVAEFKGVEAPEAVAEAPVAEVPAAEAAPTLVDRVQDAASAVVEAVAAPVAAVVDRVQDAVAAVLGTDEEE